MYVSEYHNCYILQSEVADRIYVGYTINFSRRIRQHNGELVGGAKKTQKWRPWKPLCLISGFNDNSSALRFEYRLQHIKPRRKRGQSPTEFTLNNLLYLIGDGDGKKNAKIMWPMLSITWFNTEYTINHPRVVNLYHTIC